MAKPRRKTKKQSNNNIPTQLLVGVGVFAVVIISLLWSLQNATEENTDEQHIPISSEKELFQAGSFSIVEALPHDKEAFTQGLLVHDGVLYESTGLYGRSTLRILDRNTGKVKKSTSIDDKLFGEGIVAVNDTLIMLTWKEKVALIFQQLTLDKISEFPFSTTRDEGWGITSNGEVLIISDGSANLHIWDIHTMKEIRVVEVVSQGVPVKGLNELEYIPEEDVVMANIWYSEFIISINYKTGEVVQSDDMSPLRKGMKTRNDKEDVLNGIAYDVNTGDFYFTGKLWTTLFRARRRRK
eukprot:m.68653 g.68653  ORF g.68653 m.68653 type:complete len:297 (-) comp11988_c0_seq1:175-1065(-)